jgi:hypothetical protein
VNRAETRRLALRWSQLTATERDQLLRRYVTAVPAWARAFAYIGAWAHAKQMNRLGPKVARDHGLEYRR